MHRGGRSIACCECVVRMGSTNLVRFHAMIIYRVSTNCIENVTKRGKSYSALRLFTGFASAAFTAWKLIVANAINAAIRPVNANIHHCICIR